MLIIYIFFLLCIYYYAAAHSTAYSNFRRMDILCPRTNVQLLTLTLPHQLQPVFHTTQATEVELPLASVQTKKAENTFLVCVQSAMDNAVSLI